MHFNDLTEQQKDKVLHYFCNYINYWKLGLSNDPFRYNLIEHKNTLIEQAKEIDWFFDHLGYIEHSEIVR